MDGAASTNSFSTRVGLFYPVDRAADTNTLIPGTGRPLPVKGVPVDGEASSSYSYS